MSRFAPSLAALLAGCALWGGTKETATGVPVDAPSMTVTAPWPDGATIPDTYTCDGDELSPPVSLPSLPTGTTHLALLMDDPDAPRGTWVHWLWWDGPAGDIDADTEPGTSGKNSWGKLGYGGPCPPAGSHRYFIHAYALSAPLGLPAGSDRDAFAAALPGKVLGHGVVTGTYAR